MSSGHTACVRVQFNQQNAKRDRTAHPMLLSWAGIRPLWLEAGRQKKSPARGIAKPRVAPALTLQLLHHLISSSSYHITCASAPNSAVLRAMRTRAHNAFAPPVPAVRSACRLRSSCAADREGTGEGQSRVRAACVCISCCLGFGLACS